jgi:hypothetical protein
MVMYSELERLQEGVVMAHETSIKIVGSLLKNQTGYHANTRHTAYSKRPEWYFPPKHDGYNNEAWWARSWGFNMWNSEISYTMSCGSQVTYRVSRNNGMKQVYIYKYKFIKLFFVKNTKLFILVFSEDSDCSWVILHTAPSLTQSGVLQKKCANHWWKIEEPLWQTYCVSTPWKFLICSSYYNIIYNGNFTGNWNWHSRVSTSKRLNILSDHQF